MTSSNRSPSPISSRSLNPNFRSPELPARRSFTGTLDRPSIAAIPRNFHPNTPANSPASLDLLRRNSFSKEGNSSLRASYEQKENSLKPVRVKSPSMSKGTKSFMASTISAASKVNPSPKKKVLGERNESVRNSTSSEEKFAFTYMNPLETAETEEIRPQSQTGLDSQVISDNPKISDTSSEPRISDFESKKEKVDPSLVSTAMAPSQLCPSLPPSAPKTAPSDANSSLPGMDSCVPPYDPNTNYLSPRPQFLRYRPNRRVEVYLNKEKSFDPREGTRLEDSFSSENCSDTEQFEETQPSDVEVAGDEEVLNDSKHPGNENFLEESSIGVKCIPTFHSFTRSVFVPFMLVFIVASLSFFVTDSPVHLTPSVFKDAQFAKIYEPAVRVLEHPNLRDSIAKVAEFANTNLEWLTHSFRDWSLNTLSYISKVIPFSKEELEVHFINFTAIDNDIAQKELIAAVTDSPHGARTGVEDSNPEDEEEEEIMPEYEEEEETMPEIPKGEQGKLETKRPGRMILKEGTEESNDIELGIKQPGGMILQEKTEESNDIELETKQPEGMILKVQTEETSDIDLGEEQNLTSRAVGIEKVEKFQEESGIQSSSQHFEEDNLKEACEETNTNPATVAGPAHVDAVSRSSEKHADNNTYIPQVIDSLDPDLENKFLMKNVLGISFILAVAAAIVATLYLKQKKALIPKATVLPKQQLQGKKIIPDLVSASSDSHPYSERSSLYLNRHTETEMIGESGPDETSSSLQHSSSYSQQRSPRSKEETESCERKLRRNSKRESMISSSDYSAGASYGSFTTYENLHKKHGGGDDDAMTPIRRSSRIRKQVMSPY